MTPRTIRIIVFCVSALVLSAEAQDSSATRAKLRLMAEGIIADAAYQFVDQSGRKFESPEKAPPGSRLRPKSPYTDWRYWNGVLNIAMIRLSEEFKEPGFFRFAQRNIAFSFDHYGYFESTYDGSSKWEYPYAQQFKMEELDDCGAMGASLLEVYKRNAQARYKKYIDQTAEFILEKQHRLNEGTFVRPFPPKWTVWTDDLYMSVSFLSRMGESFDDHRYFDDAIQQVINFHKHLF
jgi:rhamnogalacturonyl hydrolase YesR